MKRSAVLVVMLMIYVAAAYAADITNAFQDGVSGYTGTRDAHIYSGSVNSNYGGNTNIAVGVSSGNSYYYLLKWDVSGIPTNASVLNAYATLTISKPYYNGISWYACLRDWVESEVTWQQYAANQNWEEGGAVSTLDRGGDLISSYLTLNTTPTNSPYTLLFTPAGVNLAQSWVSAPGQNFGVKAESVNTALRSHSSEADTAAYRPELTIIYTLDPQPEIRVIRNGVEVQTGDEKTITGTAPGFESLLTYKITNSGAAALSLTGSPYVVLSAVTGCTASVATQPAGTISAAAASDCVISVTPPVSGFWSVTASIQNSDRTGSENPFTWVIKGVARGPDIEVSTQSAVVTDGTTNHLGGFMTNVTRQVLYTIKNAGNQNLTNGTPAVANAQNCSASVALAPDSVVTPGGLTAMILSVAPSGLGAFSFDLNLPNNDADEGPFNVVVAGQCTNLITVQVQEGVTGSGVCQDAYLDVANPAVNYGTHVGFDLRANNKNGLIRWDVSSVPPGSIVQSASVDLHQEDGRVYAVSLYESKRDWVVNQATWNVYSTGNSWEMPGEAGSLDRAMVPVGSATSPGTTNFMNIPLTNLTYVQSWIGSPSSNKGFAALSAGSQQINFRSSDYASSTSRPRLNLSYLPVVNPNPEITVRGNNQEIVSGSASVSSNNFTDFGQVEARWDHETAVRLYSIENSGGSSLALPGSPQVAISGAHAADFSVLSQPGTNVAGYGVAVFQIAFTPGAIGVRTALVTIASSDADEASHTFTIKGTGYERALRYMIAGNSYISPGGVAQRDTIKDLAEMDGHPAPSDDDHSGGGASAIDHRYGRNPDMDPIWWVEDGTERGVIYESPLVSGNNYNKTWDYFIILQKSEMFSDLMPDWDARQYDGKTGINDVPDWHNEQSVLVHDGYIIDRMREHSPDCRMVMYESWVRSATMGEDWYVVNPVSTSTDYWYSPQEGQWAQRYLNQRLKADTIAEYGAGAALIARMTDGWRAWNWRDDSAGLYRWYASNDINHHAGRRGVLLCSLTTYGAMYDDDVSDIRAKSQAQVDTILAALNADTSNESDLNNTDWDNLAELADRINGKSGYPKIIISSDSVSVGEQSTAAFQVKLSSLPSATVNVTVTNTYGDSSITVITGTTLSFTTGNWDQWQTVTLSAANDADSSNGTSLISLYSAPAGSSMPAGGEDLIAVEADDDLTAPSHLLTAGVNNPAWGSVSPTGGTYSAGSNVQIIATASSYYHFVQWTGALGGTTNPVTVTMSTNKTFTAVFAENLLTNSTPAWWLAQHGLGTNDSDVLASGANGLKVWESYIAGLNPTNPASVLLISDLRPLTSANVFRWQGVSGRVYSVYWSSNLLSGFQPFATNVPWTGNIFTDAVHGAENQGFYQIKVKLAE